MEFDYPKSFSDVREWAAANGTSNTEARVRLAQYSVLHAVSLSRELSQILVFKGGNALDFVWQPNRSTIDLDFSVDMSLVTHRIDADTLRALLTGALGRARTNLGIALRLQTLRPNPPGEDRTFTTFEATVGYAFQDQRRQIAMIEREMPVATVIPLDISMNDVICAASDIAFDGTHAVRTCTLEDIIAEKLRSLLQQPIRKRNRAQDLLDIAVCLRAATDHEMDRDVIGQYLLVKAAVRDVRVSRTAFHEPELIERTRYDYVNLRSTTRVMFVPFDEALDELHRFIETLPIPAT